MSDTTSGPVLAADGKPLKASLNRALRRQKMRALMLIAPLLLFILVSFVMPIADMLFRSVENQVVTDTLPRTTQEIANWDGEGIPDEAVFNALARDFAVAVEIKAHTRLGSRLNYEMTGISSLFRKSGRGVSDIGEVSQDALEDLDEAWEEPATWITMMADPAWISAQADWQADKTAFEAAQAERVSQLRAEAAAEQEAAEAAGREFDMPSIQPERWEVAEPAFRLGSQAAALPQTAELYADFAAAHQSKGDSPIDEDAWPILYEMVVSDLANGAPTDGFDAATSALLAAVPATDIAQTDFKAAFIDIDDDWGNHEVWGTISTYSSAYTNGYFLNSVDRLKGAEGVEMRPENEQIYIVLFVRTMIMSLSIMGMCVLLGYPIAWLLANLPDRKANMLMILVLLPFWTSLLVRTSAWKVLLQQQGVINDTLVWYHSTWLGQLLDPVVNLFLNGCYAFANALVWVWNWVIWTWNSIRALWHGVETFAIEAMEVQSVEYFGWAIDGYERLALINNQTGTVIAMTHILLPFMILPLYSVMKTIPPSYLRAAKSLGATNWTAFWRVYFPQSVPGIGAGCILVFILSIGYYITPELVGGTKGVFISNRIAYHISSSLNWGLAAALGTILLAVVMGLYWMYDKIVGIDNVKLGG